MLGELTDKQINDVLESQFMGRIGCQAKGKPYIVPIGYAFEDPYIFARSKEGLKIEIMRENNEVCFQVDIIENMVNWRSVILWGTYEEISDEVEIQTATDIIMEKMAPVITSETLNPQGQPMAPVIVEKEKKAIVFRIKITKKSGRYEKSVN
ncbi:pyridoxamine 5'-phosphate oxidase family protein [Marivirga salinae]|uniref:Pyridoxamine 5'-phosphate oxidase family protein n=1 Tax=Marivirga salinarum TaxID=3059078 RepID=A0AA49J9K3_9BACT|nr:pyridoxamine 5'-phosphate oxidase family protein [Marivirga sp. BDSF4-3]WKK76998.2 pyridoxamine 5'-phosphate oxidase family protein [Marivirga sp. BDSF4-3]